MMVKLPKSGTPAAPRPLAAPRPGPSCAPRPPGQVPPPAKSPPIPAFPGCRHWVGFSAKGGPAHSHHLRSNTPKGQVSGGWEGGGSAPPRGAVPGPPGTQGLGLQGARWAAHNCLASGRRVLLSGQGGALTPQESHPGLPRAGGGNSPLPAQAPVGCPCRPSPLLPSRLPCLCDPPHPTPLGGLAVHPSMCFRPRLAHLPFQEASPDFLGPSNRRPQTRGSQSQSSHLEA